MGSGRKAVKISQEAAAESKPDPEAAADTQAAFNKKKGVTKGLSFAPAKAAGSAIRIPTNSKRSPGRGGKISPKSPVSFNAEVIVESIPARTNHLSTPRTWQSSLFGCQLTDKAGCKICIKTTACPCLAAAEISSFGEFETAPDGHKMQWCCLYLCCPPCVAYLLRSGVRELFNVKGSAVGDCLACLFCHSCAMCQELRFVREVAPTVKLGQPTIPSAMKRSLRATASGGGGGGGGGGGYEVVLPPVPPRMRALRPLAAAGLE